MKYLGLFDSYFEFVIHISGHDFTEITFYSNVNMREDCMPMTPSSHKGPYPEVFLSPIRSFLYIGNSNLKNIFSSNIGNYFVNNRWISDESFVNF